MAKFLFDAKAYVTISIEADTEEAAREVLAGMTDYAILEQSESSLALDDSGWMLADED